jgi:opacity protein-like surface antigen
MKSIITACGAAVIAAAFATPAAAATPPTPPQSGTYSGTSADGSGISFVVATDANTGFQEIVSAGIGFSAPCKNSTYVLDTGWGFGASDDIDADNKVTISATDNYFTFEVKLTFSHNGLKATGTITSYSPTLEPVGTKPKKALFCESPEQTLTLAYESPDVPAKAPVNTHAGVPKAETLE